MTPGLPGVGTSMALLTDLYQLTMAYGYWKSGRQDHEAVFYLFFRRSPFGGGYTIAAGLEPVVRDLVPVGGQLAQLETVAPKIGMCDDVILLVVVPQDEHVIAEFLAALFDVLRKLLGGHCVVAVGQSRLPKHHVIPLFFSGMTF